MVKKFGEERGFTVLLEQVRSEVQLVAEGLVALDQKFDRRFASICQEMNTGFSEVRTDIRQLAKQVQEHEKTHST